MSASGPVAGPTCWRGRDLAGRDDWQHRLDAESAAELVAAAQASAGRAPETIAPDEFSLPRLAPVLARIRAEVLDGAGFSLLRGLPVEALDEAGAARALWLVGLHLGVPQPQDAAGAMLHRVRDTGARTTDRDDVRTYETNEAQPWHNDGGDLFALLCRRASTRGGRSFVVSAHTAYNDVLARDADLAAALCEPFAFDARGQQRPGRPPVQRVPVFSWHGDRLFVLQKRHYIDLAQRFDSVAPLTERQHRALDALDAACDDPDTHLAFDLEPGDVEVGHNFTVLHARGAFDDGEAPDGRDMYRLWLGLPDGWALPEAFRDSREFGGLFSLRSA